MKDAKFGGSLGLLRRVSVKFGLEGVRLDWRARGGYGQVDWFPA